MDKSSRWTSLRGSLAKSARWGVSLVLVGVLLVVVDLGEIYLTLASANLLLLFLAVGIALADRAFMVVKWFPLLRIQLPNVSFRRAFRAYFASNFAAVFLPASVGGDVVRSIALGRDREAVMEVGASIVLERVLGVIASGIVALFVLWIALNASIPMEFLVPWALVCAGVGLLCVIVPFSTRARHGLSAIVDRFSGRKWIGFIERFGEAYGLYCDHTRTLLVVGFLSVVEQIVPVFVFWAGARALHLDLSFEALLVAVPLTIFAARLPISVAGIGVVEGGLVYLLGLFGAPATHALSLAVAGRIVELFTLLPGALWWKELGGGSWDILGADRQEEATGTSESILPVQNKN